MPSPTRVRSKEEKRLIDTGHAILDDPKSTNADKLKAMGFLERAARLAERRRQERREDADWYPAAPAEPTVDDLVTALEAKNRPHSTDSDALEAPGAPTSQSNVPEVTPNALEAVQAIADGALPKPVLEPEPAPKCGHCHAPAPDPHMFWPIAGPSLNRQRLCPDCFRTMCSLCARSAPTPPPDPAPMADFATLLGIQGRVAEQNFAKSQEIWAEQDIENAERQEQERKEQDRAEARKRADLANRLSGNFGWLAGGRL